ncbi:predicted protein, partial [Arabidopsis lyrata subsp. lyrata]
AALQAQADTKEWLRATAIDQNDVFTLQEDSGSRWTRPPSPFVKCNYDASFNPHTHQVTGGWVIRDTEGKALSWGSARLRTVRSPLEAEGEALLFALQQSWSRAPLKWSTGGDDNFE